MSAKSARRRGRSAGTSIPGDHSVLRRLALAHLKMQLLFLLWEETEGDDFAVLWAATGDLAHGGATAP